MAIAAVVFGQLAMAVHACGVQEAARAVPASHAGGPPCADSGGAPPAGTQGAACESHCSNGIVGAAQPDVPAATLTALPAPTFAVTEPEASDGSLGEALLAVSRAPPLTLQFCRLLI